MSEVKFKLAAGTNVGLFRQNNEDNFVVCPDLNTSEWLIPQDGEFSDLGELGALLVVADGMGGANAGEVASAIAVQTIQEQFVPDNIRNLVSDDAAIQKFMKDVVKMADMNILNRSKSDHDSHGMGTTIVMAWLLGRRAYVCWCGDSRCYAMNELRGLRQLSKDHSFVQELVDRGELDPEFMHDHPMSNVITRCLGDMEKRAAPETRIYELSNGDSIMLCSDGLSGLCDDGEIETIITQFGEYPMDCTNELISAALNNGGHDNVTVAICTVETSDAGEQTIRKPKGHFQTVPTKSLNDTVKSYDLKEESKPDKVKVPIQENSQMDTEDNSIEDNIVIGSTEDDAPPATANVCTSNTVTADKEDDKPKEEENKKEETEDKDESNIKENEGEGEDDECKKRSHWIILLIVLIILAIAAACVFLLTQAPAQSDAVSDVIIKNGRIIL